MLTRNTGDDSALEQFLSDAKASKLCFVDGEAVTSENTVSTIKTYAGNPGSTVPEKLAGNNK